MVDLAIGQADFEALSAEVLGAGGILRFRARGGSMYPLIRDGDIVEVSPADVSTIRRGDVVFCRLANGRLIAHRVARLARKDGRVVFVTRGDALRYPDEPVTRDQVLGRVVVVQRGARRIRLDRPLSRALGIVQAWLVRPILLGNL